MSVPAAIRLAAASARRVTPVLWFLLCASRMSAQEADAVAHREVGTWTIAPFVGYAQRSPLWAPWGTTTHRNHLMFGVHLATSVARVGPVSLQYTPGLTPLIVVSNNPEYELVDARAEDGRPYRYYREAGRSPVYGTGLSPAGLAIQVDVSERVQLHGGSSAGALWFSRNMPNRDARRFNFAFDLGGGARVRLTRGFGVNAGYKLLHISNAHTARSNPGLDGHLAYGGVQWEVTVRR